MALAETEPADSGGEPLQRNATARELDPGAQRVGADDLYDRVLATPEVGRIAAQHDPPKRPDAARQDRPHVGLDESGDLRRLGEAVRLGLRPQPVPVLEDDGAAPAMAEDPVDVREQRGEDRVAEGGRARIGIGRLGCRVAERDVAPQRVVCRRLIGHHVERDAVRDQPGNDLGRIRDERDDVGPVVVLEGCNGLSVAIRDDVHPAFPQAPLGSERVDLDDDRAPAVLRNREALRSAHAAQPRCQHPAAREVAAEVRLRDRAERLVCESQDPLRSDVEPARRRHLPEHRQAGALESVELLLRRPGRDEHPGRDQHPRRVLVTRDDRRRPSGLHEQRLIAAETLQRGDYAVEVRAASRRLPAPAVDHEAIDVLTDLRIKVVQQAAEGAFLLPAATAKDEAAGSAGASGPDASGRL